MSCILKRLRKQFSKVVAVDDIEFSFHPGEVHGFIGPNGAGKTTTMRMLATLEAPTSGDASIMGCSIMDNPQAARRRIGFVPDWFSGFSSTTVHEYLDFFARACGIHGRRRIVTVGEIEEFTGLAPLQEKLINELSRGMQQRVCLGRALVNNPDVLLMDEPAANLDPRARIELRELVKILAERKKAILISSHILPELAEMCDSVTIIDKGKILATGRIDEIKKKMKSHKTIAVKALCDSSELERNLLETPGISSVRQAGNEFQADYQGDEKGVADLLRHMVGRGVPIVEWRLKDDNLEDLFLSITEKNNGK